MANEEEELLQLAIQRSLMEGGVAGGGITRGEITRESGIGTAHEVSMISVVTSKTFTWSFLITSGNYTDRGTE